MGIERAIEAAKKDTLVADIFSPSAGTYYIHDGACNVCWPAMFYKDEDAANQMIAKLKSLTHLTQD